MILIAIWFKDQDLAVAPPAAIYWSSGEAATHEDYLLHRDGTSLLIHDPFDGSMRLIMIPQLAAVAFYDLLDEDWKVQPEGEVVSLGLKDPHATDDEIEAEMSTFPLTYRVRILRSKE